MTKTRFLIAGLLAGAAAMAATAAAASPITITETVVASGSLDGDAFTDALVTFVGTGDTSNVVGQFQISNLPLNVSVAGGGSDNFVDSIAVVANSGSMDIGLGDFTTGLALLFVGDFPGGYNLKSNYSLTGNTIVNNGASYNTSGGTFSFSSTAETATFNAQVSGGVPEPATWALMIMGFGLTGAALRGRYRKAQAA